MVGEESARVGDPPPSPHGSPTSSIGMSWPIHLFQPLMPHSSTVMLLKFFFFNIIFRKQPLCICKGKSAYNIPPPYLRIAKSL
ncbi:hypothetical protein HKD37_06G015930 [Glycine soja]